MGRGVLLSGTLHVVVTLALVVGLPSFVSVPEVPPSIPVELVELEEDQPEPAPPADDRAGRRAEEIRFGPARQ